MEEWSDGVMEWWSDGVSHGDSSRDGSGKSLDSPEGQWSIGFQPVFCSHVPRC